MKTQTVLIIGLLFLAGGCAHSAKPLEIEQDEDQGALAHASDALLGTLRFVFVEPARPLLETLGGKTAFVAARKMENQQSPDERRSGINFLVDHSYGRHPPYTTRYQQIAQTDPDYTVRAVAVRAGNRARDKTATPTFIKALNDKSEVVRMEAAKALANVPDPASIQPLQRIVENTAENRDVRIAAADALRNYRDPAVARTLINVLTAKEFAVAWQARQSLIKLTNHDMRYDPGAWMSYIAGPLKPMG